MEFFGTSQSLGASEFIALQRRIRLLSQLLTCPFGVNDEMIQTMSQIHQDYLQDELSAIYKQWEEVSDAFRRWNRVTYCNVLVYPWRVIR